MYVSRLATTTQSIGRKQLQANHRSDRMRVDVQVVDVGADGFADAQAVHASSEMMA